MSHSPEIPRVTGAAGPVPTLLLTKSEYRQACVDAGELNVVALDAFPPPPGQPPPNDRRRIASPGRPGGAVGLVAETSGNAIGRLVVGERLARCLAGAQPGEGQVQYGGAHLGPEAAAAEPRQEPGERGHGPEP